MNDAQRWMLALVSATIGTALIIMGCSMCAGCSGSPLSPTEAATQADVAGYAAEEQECVALSATRVQYQDCVAGVKARWCGANGILALRGACGDAGLTDPVVLGMAPKDGGGQ